MHPSLLYIDPGSGSMLVQAVVGIVLGAGIFFKAIRSRISSLFGGKKRDDPDDDKEENSGPDSSRQSS